MTPEQAAAILESLAAGCSLAAALRAARVSPSTWQAARRTEADLDARATAAEEAGRRAREHGAEAAPREVTPAVTVAEPAPEPVATPSQPRDDAPAERRRAWADLAALSAAKGDTPTRAKATAEAVRALAPAPKKGPAEHEQGAPDWDRIRREAGEMAPGVMGWVLYQEERLKAADAGFPSLSPFSMHTIENFFLSGKRWLLLMGGRGYGKSTFTGRMASAIGFGVRRRAAPGPAWVCPIVSVLPVDAERRLDDLQQILAHAYLQEVKPAKSMIAAQDADNNAIAWVSSASTIGNVSGPSSFAALVDEEEKILHGRAGAIVGSLAFTFRSRPHVYGMRVSSAMSVNDTLARACSKGNGPGSPLTNFVATLGPFVDDAIEGVLAVAAWEEAHGAPDAAAALRAHALTLTPDSWQIPTWLGHPSIGNPDDRTAWTPGDAAVATRIEAEAVDEKMLEGLPPWRYWLRECASVPTGADSIGDGDLEILGAPCRHADAVGYEERGYYDR